MILATFKRWTPLALLIMFSSPAIAGHFTGKTITYIVSTKPGGGYDAYGHLIAKYLQKHLDGATVVVKNVAGAAQVAGSELVYASPPDGLTVGLFNTSLVYGQIAGLYGDKLDFGKLSWLGKAETQSRVVMVRKESPFQSVDDLRTVSEELKVAVSGKGTSTHIESSLLAKLLGLKIRPIFGFQGVEAELAVLRGDVDLMVGARSSLQHYVDGGDARFLLQYGGGQGVDVPTLDRARFSEADKAILALIDSQSHFSRGTAGPPGIPSETLKTLRDAYDAALVDPELLQEAAQANLPIDPGGASDMESSIASALNQTPEVVGLIKSIVGDGE